jgi:hypothetical protein
VAPAPIAVFAAQHPQVGDVEIFDDGSEATLVAGHFTHGHFSDFSSKSPAEAEQNVVDDIVDFLDRLFADQVVLWGSHRSRGGWYNRENEKSGSVKGQRYVWSGPLDDWAPHGVTVNAIAPGPFLTDATRRWIREKPGFEAEVAASIPMGRWGDPKEIGALALYLASEASSFMTGGVIVLDGGRLLW